MRIERRFYVIEHLVLKSPKYPVTNQHRAVNDLFSRE
jgi:hypothetical protein